MGTLQTSLQGFDNEVYLTETIPSLFREAQQAAPKVFMDGGGLVSMVSSRTKRALYTWLSQAPSMKLWEGERQIKENSGNEFTVSVSKFELTLGIDADDMADAAEVDSFAGEVAAAGDSAGQHPDTLIWDFLSTQGTTAVGYDGVPLLATNHPLKNGPNYSNLIAGGGQPAWYLLDTRARAKGLIWQVREDYSTRVIMAEAEGNTVGFMTDKHLFGVKARVAVAPGDPRRILKSEDALTEANFKTAWTQMREFDGDEGRPVIVTPTVLMVPPSLEFTAKALMNSALVGGGNTNDLAGMATVVVNPYL